MQRSLYRELTGYIGGVWGYMGGAKGNCGCLLFNVITNLGFFTTRIPRDSLKDPTNGAPPKNDTVTASGKLKDYWEVLHFGSFRGLGNCWLASLSSEASVAPV